MLTARRSKRHLTLQISHLSPSKNTAVFRVALAYMEDYLHSSGVERAWNATFDRVL